MIASALAKPWIWLPKINQPCLLVEFSNMSQIRIWTSVFCPSAEFVQGFQETVGHDWNSGDRSRRILENLWAHRRHNPHQHAHWADWQLGCGLQNQRGWCSDPPGFMISTSSSYWTTTITWSCLEWIHGMIDQKATNVIAGRKAVMIIISRGQTYFNHKDVSRSYANVVDQ